MGQNRFKNLSKLEKFQLSNSTSTWPNEGKMNGVPPNMTYSKGLQQKKENIAQTYLKKRFN